MNKSIFHSALSLAACLALDTAAFAAKPAAPHTQATKKTHSTHVAAASDRERVTIQIWGAESDQAATALNKALTDSGLRANVKEAKGKPYRTTAEVGKSQDLAAFGKAIASANTPQKSASAPALDVVIFAPLTKESAQQAMTRLGQLKGVDAKHSTADIKNGELNVRVTGTNRVSADDIYNAVHSAGIAGQFTKTPSGRQS